MLQLQNFLRFEELLSLTNIKLSFHAVSCWMVIKILVLFIRKLPEKCTIWKWVLWIDGKFYFYYNQKSLQSANKDQKSYLVVTVFVFSVCVLCFSRTFMSMSIHYFKDKIKTVKATAMFFINPGNFVIVVFSVFQKTWKKLIFLLKLDILWANYLFARSFMSIIIWSLIKAI